MTEVSLSFVRESSGRDEGVTKGVSDAEGMGDHGESGGNGTGRAVGVLVAGGLSKSLAVQPSQHEHLIHCLTLQVNSPKTASICESAWKLGKRDSS